MAIRPKPRPESVTHEGVTISTTLAGGLPVDEAARGARAVTPRVRSRAPIVVQPVAAPEIKPLPKPGEVVAWEHGIGGPGTAPVYHYMPNEKTVQLMLGFLRKDKHVVANYKMVMGAFGEIRNREMWEAWRRYQHEVEGTECPPLPTEAYIAQARRVRRPVNL